MEAVCVSSLYGRAYARQILFAPQQTGPTYPLKCAHGSWSGWEIGTNDKFPPAPLCVSLLDEPRGMELPFKILATHTHTRSHPFSIIHYISITSKYNLVHIILIN